MSRKLNVQTFPRPPLLERTSRHIQIKWNGETIADTKEAYWVLETHHPPTYYLPPSAISSKTLHLTRTPRSTYCEWKGHATYYALELLTSPYSSSSSSEGSGKQLPQQPAVEEDEEEKKNNKKTAVTTTTNRVWSYDSPTGAFEPIRGYLSFYAGPWDCYVDGEKVESQPGQFYGGWVTGDIEGIVKGRTGNSDPVV